MAAIENIIDSINNNKSFVLEAGAGSGKTYTLIQTINHLIDKEGKSLEYKGQRIVCITYTNIAKNEILNRLQNNPVVIVSTIHEFLWDSIKSYQKQLQIQLCVLNEEIFNSESKKIAEMSANKQTSYKRKFSKNLKDRIDEIDVQYNETTYRNFENGILHHDDVITLTKYMFQEYEKLSLIFHNKYPYILIDEYQDTAVEIVDTFINTLLKKNKAKITFGFFGDSHQKIYDSGVGALDNYIGGEAYQLKLIPKLENYRSSSKIIKFLNEIRNNIEQTIPKEKKDLIEGSIKLIHCNGNLEDKNTNYDKVIKYLSENGWNFNDGKKAKILMLANRRIAEIGGYCNLFQSYYNWFSLNVTSKLFDKEDRFVKFILGSLDKKISLNRENGIENLLTFFKEKRYNDIMNYLRIYGYENSENDEHFNLKVHSDKERIANKLVELEEKANNGTIGAVLDFVFHKKLVKMPSNIEKFYKKIAIDLETIETQEEKEKIEKDIEFYNTLKEVPYKEIRNLKDYTQKFTPFSTKHGTKGDEFKNVLFVIDDDHRWYKYRGFDKVISKEFGSYNKKNEFVPWNEDKKELMNNLFYVCCSRAMENLVILILSDTGSGMPNLIKWFGEENIINIQYL
ncbi:DNA and RNA helicase family protein [Tenacibaculum maritimum]|uniref:UvrD-helicase domain-containing protein n=1 Tax=Tenacibaculum maritimum TaxID=107401 RepID=UPI0012E465A8|nr:ATP-dependent helicase [Tenacibaculum maritimum]CAA0150023.1 DNA and RNA helicase family protein [Tenacibaculum maritimum]